MQIHILLPSSLFMLVILCPELWPCNQLDSDEWHSFFQVNCVICNSSKRETFGHISSPSRK